MSEFGSTNQDISSSRVTGMGLALTAVLLAGCSNGNNTPRTSATAMTPLTGTPSSQKATARDALITFDGLGGGSPIIQTYLGPSDTVQDRVTSKSSYRTGQTATVNCKTEGRTVHSEPNLGERDVTSKQ